jgi:hypothetical protein
MAGKLFECYVKNYFNLFENSKVLYYIIFNISFTLLLQLFLPPPPPPPPPLLLLLLLLLLYYFSGCFHG